MADAAAQKRGQVGASKGEFGFFDIIVSRRAAGSFRRLFCVI